MHLHSIFSNQDFKYISDKIQSIRGHFAFIIEKKNEIFFKYMPSKKDKSNFNKKTNKESPFGVLKNLNLN